MSSNSGFSPPTRTAGFTMIELMTTVTIMSVLAALLSPALMSARKLAVRAACANNLRQVGMAATVYANENDGRLPAAKILDGENEKTTPAWFYRLPELTGRRNVRGGLNIFQCAGYHWSNPTVFESATPKSFKMSIYLEKDGRPRQYALGSCSDEASIALFVEGKAGETGMGQWGHAVFSSIDSTRHGGAVNVLYCDGHACAKVNAPKQAADWATAIKWTSEFWQ
jgi:prepilin-type processing-associated H-X9-DG protein/prepilin-type N-terminal cleavage/methylation domain-containing protein